MTIWPHLTKISFPRLAKNPKSIAHQGARRVGDTWGLDLVGLIDDDFAAVGIEADAGPGGPGNFVDSRIIERTVRLELTNA
jgi:hypothetical protein